MPGFFTRAQGPFASDTPKQYNRKFTQIDPLGTVPTERRYLTDRLFSEGRFPQTPSERDVDFGPGGSPYVPAGAEQRSAMASLEANRRGTEPFFRTGVGTLERTAGGGDLDVTESPAFQALARARRATALDLFNDMAGGIDENTAMRGAYDSSARLAQRNRAAERVATQAAEDIAQAGYRQYGAERGYQQAAAGTGAELNPRLSQVLFGQGEQLRGAEQGATEFQQGMELRRGIAQLESYLKQRGLDDQTIARIIQYLAVASGETLPGIVGRSELAANQANLAGEAGAFGNVMGGIGAVSG